MIENIFMQIFIRTILSTRREPCLVSRMGFYLFKERFVMSLVKVLSYEELSLIHTFDTAQLFLVDVRD